MGLDQCRVSISGFRGVVGEGLDVELVMQLACTLAAMREPGQVMLGRDTRNTGPMLRHALMAGLLSRGMDVVDLGIVPTPTVGLMTAMHDSVGAINITASHNPIQWNALKLYNERGLFFSQDEVDALIGAHHKGMHGRQLDWEHIGASSAFDDPLAAHLEAVLRMAPVDVIRARNLKVAIDGCRGAGSVAGPRLLRELGCQVVELDCQPDGRFTRPLEPTPAHLSQLCEVVRREGCDIGFALDPDADRLALVDETGRAISEEYTLVLAAECVLSGAQAGSSPVAVANLSSSRMLDDVARRHSARVIRTPVGEANVVQAILEHEAVIGGEGNGGVIARAVHPGRDALTGMMLALQLLAQRETSLSRQVAEIPEYQMLKTSIPARPERLPALLDALRLALKDAALDERDGVKFSLPDSWLHVRASNTEPIVRLMAEAPGTREAERLIALARQAAEETGA